MRSISSTFSSSSRNGRGSLGREQLEPVDGSSTSPVGRAGLRVASRARARARPRARTTLSSRRPCASAWASGGVLGVDHELHEAAAVAQVDEDEPAVVAAPPRPSPRASARARHARRAARRTACPGSSRLAQPPHDARRPHRPTGTSSLPMPDGTARPTPPGRRRRRRARPGARPAAAGPCRCARRGRPRPRQPARAQLRRGRRAGAGAPPAPRSRRTRRRWRGRRLTPASSMRQHDALDAAAEAHARARACRRSARPARRSVRRPRSSTARRGRARPTPRRCARSSRGRARAPVSTRVGDAARVQERAHLRELLGAVLAEVVGDARRVRHDAAVAPRPWSRGCAAGFRAGAGASPRRARAEGLVR